MARDEELEIIDPEEEERPEYEIDDEEADDQETAAEEDEDSEAEETEEEGEDDEAHNLLEALQEERRARQELQRQVDILVAAQQQMPEDLALKLDFEDFDDDDPPTVAQVKKAIESSHGLNQRLVTDLAYAIAEIAAWNRHGGYENYTEVTSAVFERAKADETFRRELYSQPDPFEAAWNWSVAGGKPKTTKSAKVAKAKKLPKRVKGRPSKRPVKSLRKMTGEEFAKLSDEEQEALLLGN